MDAVDREILRCLEEDEGLGSPAQGVASAAIGGGMQLIGTIAGEAIDSRAQRRAFRQNLLDTRAGHAQAAQQSLAQLRGASFPWWIVGVGGSVAVLGVMAVVVLKKKGEPQ